MFHKIEGIIFDFDGTLVDSMRLWEEIDVEFLAQRGHRCPPDLQREIEGMGLQDCALYFKKRFGLEDSPEEMVQTWSRMVDKKYLQLPWKKGSVEFIREAHALGYPLAIATSNNIHLVEKLLGQLGYSGFFQTITTSDMVGASKPAPDVFLEAARRLGLSPEACLVFEDTLSGVQGAMRAGMRTIAVKEPHHSNVEEILQTADDYIVDYEKAREALRRKHA